MADNRAFTDGREFDLDVVDDQLVINEVIDGELVPLGSMFIGVIPEVEVNMFVPED